jgi:2-dehydro-3-deoxygalactonokinase
MPHADAKPAAPLVAVDWGTTSFRAYLVENAAIAAEVTDARGILTVGPGEHASVLASLLSRLPERARALPIVMSGMIGSRQGWKEAPYAATPATLRDLAGKALRWSEDGLGPITLLPGVMQEGVDMPDVMRGEETQIFGALSLMGRDEGVFIMPGTHSKSVDVRGGTILGFRTYMTGEAFAALKGHTILGRLMSEGEPSGEGFARGVQASRRLDSAGSLLNAIFGTRTLGLFERLPGHELAEYLSGLLIGAELMAGLPEGGRGVVVGTSGLEARYVKAASLLGRALEPAPDNAVVAGQIAIMAARTET